MKNAKINCSICLTDLKELGKAGAIKKAGNGKLYINLDIVGRKEPDQFGQDITIYISQTKEQRENNAPKQFVGAGKYITFDNTAQATETANQSEVEKFLDDVPF